MISKHSCLHSGIRYAASLHEFMSSLDGLNNCSSCQGGSSGACLPDRYDCQNPSFPWNIVCKAVYDDVPDETKNKVWEEAGKDGCFSCGPSYLSILRLYCATTCNWCTNQSITTTTSTITSTSTTTTENKRKFLRLKSFTINLTFCS